ncbi:MAG: SDR family NAD(P)-dependent oxidoreductase, partial [Polyangiaceae bacterium]
MNATPRTKLAAFDLSGRVILITGGSGLLGVEHAKAIADAGGTPVIADLRVDAAKDCAASIAREYGVPASAVELDVTSSASSQAALQAVLGEHGRLDGLVNNAAHNPKVEGKGLAASRFENFSLEDWSRDLAVGLTGAFLVSQVFGAHMATHGGGVIVNIASDLGVIAPDQRIYRRPGLAESEQPVKPVTYSVVKGGLVMFTKYLATYWAEQN